MRSPRHADRGSALRQGATTGCLSATQIHNSIPHLPVRFSIPRSRPCAMMALSEAKLNLTSHREGADACGVQVLPGERLVLRSAAEVGGPAQPLKGGIMLRRMASRVRAFTLI